MKPSKYSASAGLYHALRNGTVAKMKPISVKDVLLKTWAQDTNDLAEFMVVELAQFGKWVAVNERGSEIGQFSDRYKAIAAQIAYLNSAAEVGSEQARNS